MTASEIKESLNKEAYEQVFNSLGFEYTIESNAFVMYQYDRYPLEEVENHKRKLYFYYETGKYKNFITSEHGDIFSLVTKFKKLNGQDSSFPVVVEEVEKRATGKIKKNNWSYLKRYKKKIVKPEFKIYDTSILNTLPISPPIEWIEQGISEDVCEKYGIREYSRLSQTVIPMYMDGSFIGARVRNRNPELIETDGKYRPLRLFDGSSYKFPTAGTFYGYDMNLDSITDSGSVFLVEGEKSVLKSCSWFGDESIALGLMGKSLSDYRIQLLKQAGVKTIYYIADCDFSNNEERDCWKKAIKRWSMPLVAKGFRVIVVADWEQEYVKPKDCAFDVSFGEFKKIWKNKKEIKM